MGDWYEGARKYKNFRQSREEPEIPRHRGKRNKKICSKNTLGSFHIPIKVPHKNWKDWIVTQCDLCGKELEIEFPKRSWWWLS